MGEVIGMWGRSRSGYLPSDRDGGLSLLTGGVKRMFGRARPRFGLVEQGKPASVFPVCGVEVGEKGGGRAVPLSRRVLEEGSRGGGGVSGKAQIDRATFMTVRP